MDLIFGTDGLGKYYCSRSCMPLLTVDPIGDYVFGIQLADRTLRAMTCKIPSPLGVPGSRIQEWGEFVHLTVASCHNFRECVLPPLASNSPELPVHYIYQSTKPGLHVRGMKILRRITPSFMLPPRKWILAMVIAKPSTRFPSCHRISESFPLA